MAERRPWVSIVVPVYNTANFLDQCVASLLAQSQTDLEIILVDDGSPDEAPQMIDAWAQRDERIRGVHQVNQGLPAARNAGMAVATGEYIGFVDSDDWVSPTMFETLLATIRRTDSDVAMIDYQTADSQGLTPKTSRIRSGVYDRKAIVGEIFPTLIMDEALEGPDVLSVWRCLYRRGFLLEYGIAFDSRAKYSEDYLFSAAVMLRAESFVYAKGAHQYFYRSNPGSISHTIKDDSWENYVYLNQALEDQVRSTAAVDACPGLSRQLRLHMLYFAINLSNRVYGAALPLDEKVGRLREVVASERLQAALTGLRLPRLGPVLRLNVRLMRMRTAGLLLALNRALGWLRRLR